MTIKLPTHDQAALDIAIEIKEQHPDTDDNDCYEFGARIAPLVALYALEWDRDAMLEAALADDSHRTAAPAAP